MGESIPATRALGRRASGDVCRKSHGRGRGRNLRLDRGGGARHQEAGISDLTSDQRHVLTGLAVVGNASLSEEELAAASCETDVRPALASLEARGIVERQPSGRYRLIGRAGESIRNTDDALASADRLRGYLGTLADAGRLGPDRLADEAAAILGLSEWAAENQEWSRVLELVKTVQACFGIARRIEEWIALLDRGRTAAQALGDLKSEVWILQQRATASMAAGDGPAATHYLREASDLQSHRNPQAARRVPSRPAGPSTGGAVTKAAAASRHPAVWVAISVVATVVGLGGGYAVGNRRTHVQDTTTTVPVKVIKHGKTVTFFSTVSLPAVTSTVTSVSTIVSTETTTVTTGPA
jgi:hypothetical protein